MADLDRLLEDFIAAHRAGEDPDPLAFLERTAGADRAELASLIDAYLARAPRQAWDPAAFADSPARDVADALAESLSGESGAWPLLLPRLRARARLRRDEVVRRLAQALEVGDHEQKVAAYYHRMERGSLPARGVSGRVLDALGGIVGVGADALRRAGEAVEAAGAEGAGAPVFARRAEGAPAPAEAEAPGAERVPEAGRDEVDELFTGG